jgi:hypothetical protein
MKTGKYISLGDYNNIKIGYGTIDHKNLKTIYLKLNSWIQPKRETEDFNRIIFSSRKKIKNIISDLRDERFKSESIVDLDIRTNGIKLNKRSFMNLEVTLYVDRELEIRSADTKQFMKKILKKMVDETLNNKSLYNFHKTKK